MTSLARPEMRPGIGPAAAPARTTPVHERLFSRWTAGLATVMLAASVFLPPSGMGLPLCWWKGMTGLPCPGCGMTRSITSITHLHFADALSFHPFGFVLYAVSLVVVAAMLVPRLRARLVGWLAHHDRNAQRVYWVLVGSFVAFGVARTLLGILVPDLIDHL